MSDDESPEEVDCDSGGGNEESQSRQNTPNETQNKQNKSFFDRFWSFAESHIPPPIDEDSKAAKIRKNCKEEIKFWFEIAGFFIGTLVAGFVIFQSIVLTCQWSAMRDQVREMQKDRNLDERAWVLAIGMPKNVTVTYFSTYIINISFKNTGKTPGVNVRSFCNWTPDKKAIPETDDVIKAWEDEGFCAPDSGGEMQPLDVVPKTALDHATDTSPIFIYGTIKYDDIFKNSHFSQFCYKIYTIAGQIEFTGCDVHNSCDDSEPNQTR